MTGGKQKLLGISKRGNRYVRKFLVHGARTCFRHLDRTRDRLGGWLDGLQSRMHPNKAVAALAAKIARIVWVVPDQAWTALRTQGPCIRLALTARLQGSGRVMTKQWISMP
ncbi:transposase [Mesorhizobium sp.]|uniref:transposase n=1 Tax=Mesorhizobium sp. TaxID=1871066 RepID=UPI00257FDD2C|nr:transposase [Mesorhizobium sp.]